MNAPADNPDFRISPSRPVGDELRRVASAEIAFAIGQMARVEGESARAVHQCRKSLKRLRSIVRLAAASGRDDWHGIDRVFRDVGRLLAPVRDETTAFAALERLLPHFDAKTSRWRKNGGTGQRFRLRKTAREVSLGLTEAQAELPKLFGRTHGWTMARVKAGVELVYASAVANMQRFVQHGRESSAHEWRKDVQRHANQLRLIEDCVCFDLETRLDDLGTLARLLGEHHDLTVLKTMLKSGRLRLRHKSAKALRRQARDVQKKLRARALPLGARLFPETPAEFADRLAAAYPGEAVPAAKTA